MNVRIPRFPVSRTLAILGGLAGLPYEDEGVDQLQHALQTAEQARAAGADTAVVAAALLHDIGRAPGISEYFRHRPHEEAGAEFCRLHCDEPIAYLVGQHVPAKRYLVATDSRYAQTLSPASQRSLARQGGPMTPSEAAGFESHPQAREAALLRRWDDAAKVPGVATHSLESYRPVLQQVWKPDPGAGQAQPAPPRACCFDFDGLLIDTAAAWDQAYAEVCRAHGAPADAITFTALRGASVAGASDILSARLGTAIGPGELLQALARALASTKPTVRPGAGTLLRALAGSMPLMVASNAPLALVEETLTRTGLRSFFTHIITAGDVSRPKPAPDVYLAACRHAGVSPDETIAFEDSLTGLYSAHAAGLRVIGIPGGDSPLPADLEASRLDDPWVLRYLRLPPHPAGLSATFEGLGQRAAAEGAQRIC